MTRFTFDYIRDQYRAMLDAGYRVVNCAEYVALRDEGEPPQKLIVNRVDVDFSLVKADRLRALFDALGIKGSFFIRLHAKEYNPFDFENYQVVRRLIASGHELGYHSEVVDQSVIWSEDALDNLRRDIAVMNAMYGVSVQGVASHGGMTGHNNLDFWQGKAAEDLGLLYEAYEPNGRFGLFNNSLYVTDSEWTRWKAYRNGELLAGDRRSPVEHVQDSPSILYLLIHSDTYYDRHPYEQTAGAF
jgi:hypothetical protein